MDRGTQDVSKLTKTETKSHQLVLMKLEILESTFQWLAVARFVKQLGGPLLSCTEGG